jgi:ADP-heptose:LPS heptosyltransferase
MELRKAAFLHALIYAAYVRRKKPASNPYKKCAIFKLDGLGDAVLALGTIRYIAKRFGEENCILICWSKVKEFMAHEFPGMEMIGAELPAKLLDSVQYLRTMKQHAIFSRGVSLLISLRHHRTMHHDLILSAIPAEITVGAPATRLSDFRGELIRKSRVRFDKLSSPIAESGGSECKELALHASVLSCAFGAVIKPDELVSRITRATNGKNINPKLVIAPFTGSTIRDIGAAQLTDILDAIHKKCHVESVIVSSPADRKRAEQLVAILHAKGLPRISTTCTETVEQFIQVLADAGAVLTADSSPAHLAAALDMPMVALIGGGHPGWFGYWRRSDKQTWLEHRVPCYGCNWNCIYDKPVCLTEISAELIAREIITRLPVQRAA